MRLLNVAHGEFVMIGAYVAYWGIKPVVGKPVYWQLRGGHSLRSSARRAHLLRYFSPRDDVARAFVERIEANSLLIFFGVSVILQNVASLLFTANLRGYRYQEQLVSFWGATLPVNKIMVLVIAVGFCIASVVFFFFSTKFWNPPYQSVYLTT